VHFITDARELLPSPVHANQDSRESGNAVWEQRPWESVSKQMVEGVAFSEVN